MHTPTRPLSVQGSKRDPLWFLSSPSRSLSWIQSTQSLQVRLGRLRQPGRLEQRWRHYQTNAKQGYPPNYRCAVCSISVLNGTGARPCFLLEAEQAFRPAAARTVGNFRQDMASRAFLSVFQHRHHVFGEKRIHLVLIIMDIPFVYSHMLLVIITCHSWCWFSLY